MTLTPPALSVSIVSAFQKAIGFVVFIVIMTQDLLGCQRIPRKTVYFGLRAGSALKKLALIGFVFWQSTVVSYQ